MAAHKSAQTFLIAARFYSDAQNKAIAASVC
jgi:hypothetical protein